MRGAIAVTSYIKTRLAVRLPMPDSLLVCKHKCGSKVKKSPHGSSKCFASTIVDPKSRNPYTGIDSLLKT